MEDQSHLSSIYADLSCVGFISSGSNSGCAHTPVAVHIYLAVLSLWQ